VAQAQLGLSFQPRQLALGGLGIALALAVFFTVQNQPEWSTVWVFGLAFGFVLQRARFCFASAFRDLFLLGETRVMKGVLVGMAVAAPGFALAMYMANPVILPGRFPADANIQPLGFHTFFAGFIFAIGMTLAGGCSSGTLYRIGEGYAASVVTMLGILAGTWLLGQTWSFWWDVSVSYAPRIWFPQYVGWGGGLLVTLLMIGLAFLALLWWESRTPVHFPHWTEATEEAPIGFTGQLRALLTKVFLNAWPIAIAGATLGILNAFFTVYHHPWGVTGAIYQWVTSLSGLIGIAPGELKGLADLGGACNIGSETHDQAFGISHDSMINMGMILGSFIAAALAGEFKLRFPRQLRRYVQSLGGGVLMGYGASLALGCTLGAFFSAIPSLGLNGWGFGVGLLGGAYVGVKFIRHIG
ncbi:MAG: YeeE/YedE family protein, partial [Chloroflexi bacterium]|nr:YeeE/YedE family protein [Chloroflexota bacterium]